MFPSFLSPVVQNSLNFCVCSLLFCVVFRTGFFLERHDLQFLFQVVLLLHLLMDRSLQAACGPGTFSILWQK